MGVQGRNGVVFYVMHSRDRRNSSIKQGTVNERWGGNR
jgi:hypothetical protein